MTKALILAAGQGTRLRPLTNDSPKCLVNLAGRSLLSRQVETLNMCGITDIHIATGYLSSKIEKLGFPCTINKNYASTNMVESLFSCRDFLMGTNGEDLIISYGDIVYEPRNLQSVLTVKDKITFMADRAWGKLWSLRFDEPMSDAETLVLDSEGFVRELGQPADSLHQIEGQYTGLIKLAASHIEFVLDAYDCLKRGRFESLPYSENMYLTDFLQYLISRGSKIRPTWIDSGWLEVDSISDLSLYETLHESDDLDQYCKLL